MLGIEGKHKEKTITQISNNIISKGAAMFIWGLSYTRPKNKSTDRTVPTIVCKEKLKIYY